MNLPKSRRLLLVPIALLVLGAVLVVARTPRVESRPEPQADDSPEACVNRLLAAEERGDARAYLDCFAPLPRAELETVWQGRSPAEIAAELRRQSAGLVGRAVTDVKFTDPDHARLVLHRDLDRLARHPPLAVQVDERLRVPAKRFGIDDRRVPEQHPVALETIDPPLDGRCAQMDVPADVLKRATRIFAEQRNDCPVGVVHRAAEQYRNATFRY